MNPGSSGEIGIYTRMHLHRGKALIQKGSDRNHKLLADAKQFGEFVRMIHQHIGVRIRQGLRGETVAHTHGPQSCIVPSLDIGMGVADNGSLFGPNPTLRKQFERTLGIRLLGFKAIAAVHLKKIWFQPHRLYSKRCKLKSHV